MADTPSWPFSRGTIPGKGTFLVGRDIAPGTYYQPFGNCCLAVLSDATGSLDDIIVNDSSAGTFVTMGSGGFAFDSSGCGTWVRQ